MDSTEYRLLVGGCSGSYAPASFEVKWEQEKIMRIPFSRHEYGTHTTSFGVYSPEKSIGFVIDNGFGVDIVSNVFMKAQLKKVFILQTHFHKDHVDGLPQNQMLFIKNGVELICSPRLSYRKFEEVFEEQFNRSNWPIRPEDFGVNLKQETFSPGQDLRLGNIKIRTLGLNHPGGSVAYRFCLPMGDFVIGTDIELSEQNDREAFCEFAKACRILVVDVQYRDAEYMEDIPIGSTTPRSRIGWGHSTPNMLYNVFLNCGTPPESIAVTHHDPNRSDDDLVMFEKEVKKQLYFVKNVHFLREGQIFRNNAWY